MATVRSTSWTGSNGAAWTLDSGSWTQVTESGSFSAGPTENIQTNKGRANGTASASAVRRHHASSTTFLDVEASVNVVRSALTCKPGLMIRATGTGASSSFYLLQFEAFAGKSTTYGVALYKCVSGVYTQLYNVFDGTIATTANTLYLKLRSATFANGNVKLQGKCWSTGSSEPAWVDLAGDSVTSYASGSSFVYIDNTTTIKDTAGTLGIYTEIEGAVAYQADYDDLLVIDSWNNTLVATVISAPSTVIDQHVLAGYPHTLSAPVIATTAALLTGHKINRSITAPVISAPATLLSPKTTFNVRLPVIDSNQVTAFNLKDTFDRADSTTVWGDGGVFWTSALNSATIGTSANRAYVSGSPSASPGSAISLTNFGIYQDGSYSVDLFNVQDNAAVFLKYKSPTYWLAVHFFFFLGGLGCYLTQSSGLGGSSSLIYNATAGSDVTITATYTGDLVRVTVADYWTKVVLGTNQYIITDANLRGTATYSGFGAFTSSAPAATRYDNWYQTQSNSTGLISGPQPPKVNLTATGALLAAPATLLPPQVNLAAISTSTIAAPATLLSPTVTQASAYPPVFAGVDQVTAIYAGTTAVTKLYAGTTQVWP